MNDQQGHIVLAWSAAPEAGDIAQDTIDQVFRIAPGLTLQRTDEPFFLVCIAFRILRLRDAVRIEKKTVPRVELCA